MTEPCSWATVDEVVSTVARDAGLPERDLRSRARMECARLPVGSPPADIRPTVQRLGDELRDDLDLLEEFVAMDDLRARSPRSFVLDRATTEEAEAILEHGHYLRSHRKGDHFAAREPERRRVVAFFSVAPEDWDRLLDAIPAPMANVVNLARVYAAPGAPYNTISRMLSLLLRELASRPEAPQLVTTTVDPNLGFTGASYKASGWELLDQLEHRGYLYLDGRYTTRRVLRREFGTDRLDDLLTDLGGRIQLSTRPMRDKLVFWKRLGRS